MRAEDVKKILLEIEETEVDFTLIFSGKKSKRVNGLYKSDTHEIILHNHNFETDNELIYTAIHEYTHHRMNEIDGPLNSRRPHTNKFWAMFHRLLSIAEEKGFYKIEVQSSSKLDELTRKIRDVLMVEDGKILKELGSLLKEARELCRECHIRYEDYIDRVLKMQRGTASSLERISSFDLNPAIGYDAMKAVASIKNPEKRREAEELYASAASPAVAKQTWGAKQETESERDVLEREKRRIERAIENMKERLKSVELKLSEME